MCYSEGSLPSPNVFLKLPVLHRLNQSAFINLSRTRDVNLSERCDLQHHHDSVLSNI